MLILTCVLSIVICFRCMHIVRLSAVIVVLSGQPFYYFGVNESKEGGTKTLSFVVQNGGKLPSVPNLFKHI